MVLLLKDLLYYGILFFCLILVLINLMMQFVALTQPLNAFAFVFDGLHYGASDFAYAAVTMVS